MDYDADRITFTNQNLAGPGQDDGLDDGNMSAMEAKRQFREFIRSYRDGNLFPYRDQVNIYKQSLLSVCDSLASLCLLPAVTLEPVISTTLKSLLVHAYLIRCVTRVGQGARVALCAPICVVHTACLTCMYLVHW